MRTTILFSSIVLLWATAALGQEVGDRIIVIADNALLKSPNDIVGSVPKGKILTVREVNGDGYLATYSSGKGTLKGWIKRQDVVPVDKALDVINDSLRRNPTEELQHI